METFYSKDDLKSVNELNETESVEFSEEEYTPPKTKNSYDLLELKGKGGQGEVWKARDKETGKIVALKILNVSKRKNLEFAEKEIKALEKLSRPCYLFISCYYAHYYDAINNQMLIEMEYISGNNLEQFRKQFLYNPQKLYESLIFLMRDMLVALKYIHSKNIIHRDIKPENILITTGFVPKLVDFGLACEAEICNVKNKCCPGNPGTPVYMAPETISSRESYFVSDVWSLGATIFKIASGVYCFDFEDVNDIQKILYDVVNLKVNKLKTSNRNLNIAINASLIKNPNERITIDNLMKLV
jgi:serine/threonine protein kinase